MFFNREIINRDKCIFKNLYFYLLLFQVLGVGINGKVVECENLKSGEKFALKILRDVPKAKREAELHFLSCNHPNIVKIYEVYENTYNGIACLFLVMERMVGGNLGNFILALYIYFVQANYLLEFRHDFYSWIFDSKSINTTLDLGKSYCGFHGTRSFQHNVFCLLCNCASSSPWHCPQRH